MKIAKVAGVYVEHAHADSDQYFHVREGGAHGRADRRSPFVVLPAGSICVVPRGQCHRPSASPGTRLLTFERRGTVNSGDAAVEGTAGLELAPRASEEDRQAAGVSPDGQT